MHCSLLVAHHYTKHSCHKLGNNIEESLAAANETADAAMDKEADHQVGHSDSQSRACDSKSRDETASQESVTDCQKPDTGADKQSPTV